MKKLLISEIRRYIILIIGLFVCAMGSVFLLNSNLGLSPWDVLHQGLSLHFPISIGQASIILGIIIVAIDMILGQPIGIGTVINFIMIGVFMDFILFIGIIPKFDNIFLRLVEILLGVFCYGFGTFLYMSRGMGCGPRDGLMQILTKRLNKPVGLIKNSIEIGAFSIGALLGGKLGVGTIVTAVLIGPVIEYIFNFFKVDVKKLKHRNIKVEYFLLKKLIFRR